MRNEVRNTVQDSQYIYVPLYTMTVFLSEANGFILALHVIFSILSFTMKSNLISTFNVEMIT